MVSVTRRFAGNFRALWDGSRVPSQYAELERPLLLHCSDTPSSLYRHLRALIRRMEPDYVIHTGDVADEIKLEFCPGELSHYTKTVRKLFISLEELSHRRLFVVPGNHDDAEVLDAVGGRTTIVAEGTVLDIEGVRIGVSHRFSSAASGAAYHLYGHASEPPTHRHAHTACINGMAAISVISLSTGALHYLPYPASAHRHRSCLLPKPGL